ncbi:alpha/beta-hydrolase [Poronia punctata]|nr:alpha/beta-hydrolase [Poronia punctata]
MPPRPAQWAVPLGVSLGVPVCLYLSFLLLGGFPFFQRHFFYAHRINTLFWHDVDKPEYWGFARNQVTPFNIASGNETLYAWHILPTKSILKYEAQLQASPAGFSSDITLSNSFKILQDDKDAKLVISFHGNAGHIAQGLRTDHFHSLTDTSEFHVLSIDYRGYGKSTGSPSEAGLIQDGVAAVEWAINVADVPSSRIVVMGQSLGTAVTCGVVEDFAMRGIEFAGVILIAGFSNVPDLLSSYSGAGFIPVLSPLRRVPSLLRRFQSYIVDKWESANRLSRIVRSTEKRLHLQLIHAKNDLEIPCHESDVLFKSAASAATDQVLEDEMFASWKEKMSIHHDDGSFTSSVTAGPDITIRQELVPYGGHNAVMLSAAIPLAVMRAFSSAANHSMS